jgi:hypothetical protein
MIEVQDVLADELTEVPGIATELAIFSGLGDVFVEGDGFGVFEFVHEISVYESETIGIKIKPTSSLPREKNLS